MPITVFDVTGIPAHRRERIEAAVVAGGKHVSGRSRILAPSDMAFAERTGPMAIEDQEQHRRTVAIVDDDAAFRSQLRNVLLNAGYKTIEAADGPSALAAIESEGKDLDLMIVDLCLPDKTSGLDVIVAAKRREIPAKIIAATAVLEQPIS